MYLLDTNVWSKLLSGRSRSVADRMRLVVEQIAALIKYPSVVRAELEYGATKVSSVKTLNAINAILGDYESLPFDDTCTLAYAEIRCVLEKAGMKIGSNDLIIASIAKANGLIVVTNNTSEFSRVPGLKLEDWELP